MCTAISVKAEDHYFGRNLDYTHSFGEKITVTPRKYPFSFGNGQRTDNHLAIIGMALPYENYPLYFDATNEKGLSMAGLLFPQSAHYNPHTTGEENIASFELIPWVLCQCETVLEAETLMEHLCITEDAFRKEMPPSPLHWLIADKNRAVTVEQTQAGLFLYKNPVGVLTNNPAFDMQMLYLTRFLSVTAKEPENRFSDNVDLKPDSKGMGGIGLPGDLSSMSRFVRACFMKLHSVSGTCETENLHQFFHILHGAYQQKGCVETPEGLEMTHYTSCCNTDKGIYYYTTYYNSTIHGVDMHAEDLNGKDLIVYEPNLQGEVILQNKNRQYR